MTALIRNALVAALGAVVCLAVTAPAEAQEFEDNNAVQSDNTTSRSDPTAQSGAVYEDLPEAPTDAPLEIYQARLDRDLYKNDDLMLQGLSAVEDVWFTRPLSWQLEPGMDPEVVVRFSHSPALLENRSSITVLVNEQAVGSVNLSHDNADTGELRARIPAELLHNHNRLSFVVNQHYTNDCEDPFDPSLWTRVHADSYIEFSYRHREVDPDLKLFPYPLWDELGYGPLDLAPGQSGTPSVASLHALGQVSFALGRFAGWRGVVMSDPVGSVAEATTMPWSSNPDVVGTGAVMVGLVDELPELDRLLRGAGLTDIASMGDNGLVAIVPNPDDPTLAVLVVTGRTPEALAKAASAVAGHDRFKMLSGRRAMIDQIDDWAPPESQIKPRPAYGQQKFSLEDILFSENVVYGFYAPEIGIPVKMMGDAVVRPGGGRAKIVYSYSAGLDVELSNMEVRLNGVPLRSVKLDRIQGEQEAELTVNLPYEIVDPHSNLDVVFHLFPNDFGPCQRVSDRHLWGTVFKRSTVKLPRDRYADMPDLSRLRYAAFPYDLQDPSRPVAIVLPDKPSGWDVSAGMQLSADLGRLTVTTTPDLTLTAAGAEELTQTQQILLVHQSPHQGYDDLQTELTTTGELDRFLSDEGKPALDIKNTSPMASVEQVLLEDKESTRLVVRAPTADSLLTLSRYLLDDAWVQELTGNLALVRVDETGEVTGDVTTVDVATQHRMAKMTPATWLRLLFQEQIWLFGILAVLLFIAAAILIRMWAASRGGTTE